MIAKIRGLRALSAALLLPALLVGRCGADETILSNLGLLEQLTNSAADELATQVDLPDGRPVVLVGRVHHEGNAFVLDRLARALSARGHEVFVDRTVPDTTAAAAAPGAGSAAGPRKGASAGAFGADPGSGAATPADAGGTEAAGDTSAAPGVDDALTDAPEPAGAAAAGEEAEPPVSAAAVARGARGRLLDAATSQAGAGATVLDVEVLEFGVRYSEVGRKLLLGPVQFTRVAGVYLRVAQHDGASGALENVVTAERHHWDRVSGRERFLAEGASYPFAPPELKAPGLGNYLEPALVVGIVSGLVFLFYENQN